MTAEDIQNAAKEFFDLNKTSITVLHPKKANKDEILKYDLCPADIPLAEYVKEMK